MNGTTMVVEISLGELENNNVKGDGEGKLIVMRMKMMMMF